MFVVKTLQTISNIITKIMKALMILFICMESATVSMTSLWFAAGALVALIASLLHAPVALQVVLFLAVSGTGSTRTAFGLELIALAVYMVYCWLIIGHFKMDVAVCWTAEHVYAAMLLLCSYIYMRSGRWKDRRI